MILGNKVEWALHCCVVLAGLSEGVYLATKDLAEFHGVPKEYLSKALQALSQAGIIEGTLGPQGGYRLAKSPTQINFLEIVEAVEGKRSTFECQEIRGNNPCLKSKGKPQAACSIARVMYKADAAWRKELKAITVAEIGQEVADILPRQLKADVADWFSARH